MANPDGHPASLEPYRAGNTHSLRHGVYSQRVQEPRAREVAEAILAADHTVPLDEYGALEIGRLVALIDALDAALTRGGVIGRHDKVRSVVDLRLRASRRLAECEHVLPCGEGGGQACGSAVGATAHAEAHLRYAAVPQRRKREAGAALAGAPLACVHVGDVRPPARR
jgi:hypothetical protein